MSSEKSTVTYLDTVIRDKAWFSSDDLYLRVAISRDEWELLGSPADIKIRWKIS